MSELKTMTRASVCLSVGLALSTYALPGAARACACVESGMGAGRLYAGQGGVLPQNVSGVPWAGPGHLKANDRRVDLLVNGQVTSFDVEQTNGVTIILPEGGLVGGAAVDLRVREPEWEENAVIREKVAADGLDLPPPELKSHLVIAERPLQLDTLSVRTLPPRRTDVTTSISYSGDCSDYFVTDGVFFSAVLPPHAKPFSDHLLYRTFVDGHEWRPTSDLCVRQDPGRSWMGTPGEDMVFADCTGRYGGLSRGVHEIWVEARTPDGQQSARTPTFKVEVICHEPGTPVGMRLLSPESPDGVLPAQTREGAAQSATPPPLDASHRQGCSVNVSSTSLGSFSLLLLLLGWRRSRSRSRASWMAPRRDPQLRSRGAAGPSTPPTKTGPPAA